MATSFGVDASGFVDSGSVIISWANTGQQPNHYSYRVYRAPADGSEGYTLINEQSHAASFYTYADMFAGVGTWRYAVVQVYLVSGNQTEEPKNPRTVSLEISYYWLIHPNDPSKSIQLRNIEGDEFSTEREVEIKNLLGKGRKVDVGQSLGITGSLTGHLYDLSSGRTARQQRIDLQNAKATSTYWFLRNPFGDVWKIWFDDPKFSRVPGTGTSEIVEVSFNYYEVG